MNSLGVNPQLIQSEYLLIRLKLNYIEINSSNTFVDYETTSNNNAFEQDSKDGWLLPNFHVFNFLKFIDLAICFLPFAISTVQPTLMYVICLIAAKSTSQLRDAAF